MTKKTGKAALLVFALVMLSMLVNSQTYVSGIISSNTTWTVPNNPYIVTGNVLLDSGYTLTIDPGVIIKFNNLKCLQIGGTLRAIGTNNNPITFTSNQTNHVAGYWGYILFNGTSTDYNTTTHTGNIMQYCIVESGGNQNVPNCNGAIRSFSDPSPDIALPYIDHCTIRNNSSTGIMVNGYTRPGTSLMITDCEIYKNSIPRLSGKGGGIYVNTPSPLNSTVIISGNTIHDNNGGDEGGGIDCNTSWNYSSVSKNIIYNNTAIYNGGGIFCGGHYLTVSDNILYNNTAERGAAIDFYGGIASNNIIADNTVNTVTSISGNIMNVFAGDNDANAYYNTIIDNNVQDEVVEVGQYGSGTLNYNTITRNMATALPPTHAVSLSYDVYHINNFQHNNIYRNATTYQFLTLTGQGTDVNARNCWWGTSSSAAIDTSIYDYFDNGTLGIVYYSPFLTSPDTAAPVTPPVNVIKTDIGGGNIQLTWNVNPETDLAGYKVYYGSPTGYSFSNFINVGNVTTYTISGLSIYDTIAVTAYDIYMDNIYDMFEGHESWFTNATGKPYVNFSATPLVVCAGDTVFFTSDPPETYSYSNTSYSWYFSGGTPSVSSTKNPKVIYYTAGVYDVKLKITDIAGSDSLTFSNYITVKPKTYATINPTGCDSYTSPSGKYTWTSGGIYYDTIPNHAGCDSVITIHLTISTDSYSTIYPQTCNNYISPSGKYIWSVSGWYNDTIPNGGGCDSIMIISLTITVVDTGIIINNKTLSAIANGIYQWLDCNNGYNPIPGETNQSFTPANNGNYALKITQNNCTDTSSCHTINNAGIRENAITAKVKLYPNPVNQILNIEFGNIINQVNINVIDYTGSVIATLFAQQTEKAIIDTRQFVNGIYMVRITLDNNKTVNYKIEKN